MLQFHYRYGQIGAQPCTEFASRAVIGPLSHSFSHRVQLQNFRRAEVDANAAAFAPAFNNIDLPVTHSESPLGVDGVISKMRSWYRQQFNS
jgi:hypothetical protein